MGSKGSNTTTTATTGKTDQAQTSSYAPNPQAMSQYEQILARLNNLPVGSYQGELVAPINSQQMAGVQNINDYAQFAQPGISGAMGYAQAAGQPLTEEQIRQYMNPYTQQVVDKTMGAMDLQNRQGLTALRGNAAAQNALGGNRVGIAESNYLSDAQAKQAPLIAGLYNTGYGQAVDTATRQFQQNPLQVAGVYGNLALAGQQAGLAGAGAQVGAGTLQQQTQQALDTANLQNWLLPYGQVGSQAQIAAGIGSQMGGVGNTTGYSTSNSNSATTAPKPSPWGQIAGLGIAALGAFSDERLKEDVHKVGELNDGQAVYRYRFKGSPQWQIGLIAQDVEKSHPEAVTRGVGNMRMVDYKTATDDAVERADGGPIRGFATGGMPMMGAIPPVMTSLPGVAAPQAIDWRSNLRFLDLQQPSAPQSQHPQQPQEKAMSASDLRGMADGMGKIKDWWNTATPLENYSPAQDITNANYAVGPELPGFYAEGAWAGPYARGGFVRRGYENGGVPTMTGVAGGFVPEGPELPIDPFAARFDALPVPNIPMPPPRPPMAGFTPTPAAPVAAPPPVPMDRYASAIAGIESSNDYGAVGPQTRTGDRAYGKYQVMGANIPEWTLAVVGRAMTPPEFLADPKAQDAVFQAKYGALKDKHGPSGAARAWFAGEGGMNDPGRRDILGTTVAGYENKFNRAAGIPVSGFAPEDDALPANAQPTQGPAPPGVAPRGGFAGFNPLGLSEEARLGMIAAGLGMMASRSPHLGVAIGEGGLSGLSAYAKARGTRRLEEQATLAQRKLDEQERHHRQKETLEASKPFKIGMDQMGRDIYGIRSKEGKIIPLDPVTGAPMPPQAPGGVPAVPGVPPAASPAVPGVDPNIPMTGDPTLPAGAQPVSGVLGINDPIAASYSEAALEGLPPADANRVKAIAEGRMPAMALRGRNDVYNRMIMQKVLEYNPAYDNTIYASRQRTANEFKVGMAARNLTATKTLAGHLADLHDLAKQLDNTNIPALNKVQQGFQRQTGWDEKRQELIKRYEAQAKVVADEGAKVFAGSQSALADREEWARVFDVSASKSAQMGAIKQIVRQIDSRLDALASQYNNGMMTTRQPTDMVDKKTKDIFDRLRNVGTEDKPSEPKKEMSAKDKQALAWAKNNKDKPQAKEILKRLGAE